MKDVIEKLVHIVQTVSVASSPSEQMSLIVESISKTMTTDVCSLYMANANGDMELLANHGIFRSSVPNIILPAGKGIVGKVASLCHPVNIPDAQKHPDYLYVPGTREERFHGFCAVPLVAMRKTIGVLVVQRRVAQRYSNTEEGFLVTLGAQLALLLVNLPLSKNLVDETNFVSGLRGAPGVGIGSIQFCDQIDLLNTPNAPCHDIEAELIEWRQLLALVSRQLDEEKVTLAGNLMEDVSIIFTTYRMLLMDPGYSQEIENRIRKGNWLPGALRQATQFLAEQFLSMNDPYLQARHEDIHHLGNKLYRTWQGSKAINHKVLGDTVLAGKLVSVSDIAAIPVERLKGIVCFSGSILSHTAVLANALGVPAIMATGQIPGLADGQCVIVDGHQGQLHLNPGQVLLSEYRKLMRANHRLMKRLDSLRELPSVTVDGERIILHTNTGLLADISPGLVSGAEGIGLYRTEFVFMAQDSFPSENAQEKIYRQLLSAYHGKPVYMRTIDIGGDKPLPYFQFDKEDNPALGWRGIRFSLDNSQLQMTQLRAMLKASKDSNNLNIILPMVSSTQEIDGFSSLLSDACQQLKDEGFNITRPPVGIMLEVPGAISQISSWKDKIDFISIGSNDLSQYLLAMDRNNARVASRYDHVHPAVLHEIERIITLANASEIPVSICGEMASDPVAVVLLVGLGLRRLSVSSSKLPQIKWMIRSLSIKQAESITSKVLMLDNARAIRLQVTELLGELGLSEII
jgi:phosphotransferase system enzyme I (PtsI)/phosphotransferase system enzyme I (PtsP)